VFSAKNSSPIEYNSPNDQNNGVIDCIYSRNKEEIKENIVIAES
jgi:hypothetical protein